MCGISGLLHFDRNRKASEEIAVKMRDIMSHRGPDGFGISLHDNVALAHRRLSIIDLSENGKQPFTSADGRYSITFNGEIYNYREFISEIEAKGIALRSNSDTEVLLYMYILYGPSMLTRLNGMWAFAVWDNKDKELFVCRDRMGVKPLYYAIHDNTFFFASEQKALFEAGVPLKPDAEKLEELLFYRYVSGGDTLFEKVKKLLPGHYMTVSSEGKLSFERYWNLGVQSQKYKVQGDVFEWYEHHFNKSIAYRMVSDVPVGVLLSGGLDSSAVACSLYQQGYKDINTFTIKFAEDNLNESHLAESLSKQYNFRSHSMPLVGESLYENLVKATWSHDEPLIHANDPHLVAISDYSKKYVKVLLSGEGADELMGGYVRYKTIKHWKSLRAISSLIAPIAKNNYRIKKLNRYFNSCKTIEEAILLNASNIYPEDFNMKLSGKPSYRNDILNEAKDFFGNDAVKQMLYLDQHTYMVSLLDRNDRATMSAGIECREPFLDYELVEGLASLPSSYFVKGKKGKYILYNSIGKRLPPEIRQFKKLGFNVPWEKYLRENDAFRQTLQSCVHSEILETGIFNEFNKKDLIADFLNGNNSNKMLILQFFMLGIWEKTYLKKFN